MKRNQIEEKYTWDLSKIYPSFADFEKDSKKADTLIDEIAKYENHIADDADTLLKFVNLNEQLEDIFSDLFVFAKQSLDVEPKNEQVQQAFATASSLHEKYNSKLNFIVVEITAKSKQIKELITDPRFHDLQFYFAEYFHAKAHIREKKIQQMLAESSNFGNMFHQTFETIRLTYPPVIIDGKEHFLNHGTFSVFLQNPKREIREMAYKNYYGEYNKLATTFASLLIGHIKYVSFSAKQHKFKSALEASLYNDNAPKKLFEKILYMANEKYRPNIHQYFKVLKKLYKEDVIYNYDLNVPPVTDLNLKFSIEEGLEIIYQALAPLGQDYIDNIKQGVKDRWIDFYTHEEKRSGAYSWGSYRSQPYILLNWVGELDSIYTLAHELGHSMHSFYSNKHNRSINSNYKIFVAEVASTVNEVFLTKYLLKKYQNDPKITTYLYYQFLSDIVGTIYRQPFFAEFERTLYQKNEAGEPLSHSTISSLYKQMSAAYYGDEIKLADEVGVSCYSVPHFYYRFYVYKYTIGMSCALAIVSRILNNDQLQVKNYLNFLKSGGTKWPIDLLKDAGVDPTSNKVYDEAFGFFKTSLNEFKQLLKTFKK